MKSKLLASVLAISLSGLAQAQAPGELISRVEVRSGRAEIIQTVDSMQTVRRGSNVTLRGKAHLEVPAGSEVRVSYPGQASLSVWGPASLDWQSVPNQAEPGQNSIVWNLFQTTWCDFEVRRGTHHLNLPGDWHAQMDGGSLRLRGLATGPLEMRLNAGRPVRVFWNGDNSQARPPMTVYPGSNIRLEQPQQVKVDRSSQSKRWNQPEWPYRRNSDTPEQAQDRAAQPMRLKEAPAWPAPEVLKVDELEPEAETQTQSSEPVLQAQVPSQPVIERVQVQPVRSNPVVPTQPGRPFAAPETQPVVNQPSVAPQADSVQPKAPVAAPNETPKVAPVATVPFVREQWRGLAQSKITDCGVLAVEQRKGVEVRVFAGGKTKILVDRWDGSQTWVMTQGKDYHLAPGCVAVFNAKGELEMSHGGLETYPAVTGRPVFSQVR